MSREGMVFRRCTRCGAKVEARRCSCGHDKASWSFKADVNQPGERRKQASRGGFKTKSDALTAMHKLQTTAGDGTYVQPAKLTLGQFMERWLPTMRHNLRASTYVGYGLATRRVQQHRIGNVPLQRVSKTDLRAFYADLRERGGLRPGMEKLSVQTVANVHIAVCRALTDAAEERLIPANPALGAFKMRPERPEMKVWTPAELSQFLAGTNEDRLSAMWRVAATTGVRRGELLGLRWRDVALDSGTLRVAQQRVRAAEGGYAWGAPKTEKGRRVVAVDPTTLMALKAHRVAQAKERLAWGPAYEDSDLVFCRDNGAPLDPDYVSATFERHLRRLGLPRIRLHDLRHTHATMALAAGIHPRVVQERLGHASISVTLDTYSHSVPGLQEEAAGRIAALLEHTG